MEPRREEECRGPLVSVLTGEQETDSRGSRETEEGVETAVRCDL